LEDVEVGCQGPSGNKKIRQFKDDFVKIWNSAKDLEGMLAANSHFSLSYKLPTPMFHKHRFFVAIFK
jgi:hypothetical protein